MEPKPRATRENGRPFLIASLWDWEKGLPTNERFARIDFRRVRTPTDEHRKLDNDIPRAIPSERRS